MEAGFNFRQIEGGIALSLDERTDEAELEALAELFTGSRELCKVEDFSGSDFPE